jgi:hypothetical protein
MTTVWAPGPKKCPISFFRRPLFFWPGRRVVARVGLAFHVAGIYIYISTAGKKNVWWTILTIYFFSRIRTAKEERNPFFENGTKIFAVNFFLGRQNFLGGHTPKKKVGHRRSKSIFFCFSGISSRFHFSDPKNF